MKIAKISDRFLEKMNEAGIEDAASEGIFSRNPPKDSDFHERLIETSRLISELNPQQQQAIRTTSGKVLVLAGAGSGKTTVLTYRIAYLIHQGVAPEEILGLTFTNKAAAEMRERVFSLIGKNRAKKITLCTFHSLCMQLLRKEIHHLGYTKNFSLYDEREVRRLLLNLSRQLLEHEGDLPSLETAISTISDAKLRGIKPDELPMEEKKWHDTFTKSLFEHLEVCMRAYNAVDFDTLLSLTVELFEKFPQVLQKYQNAFRYIMIDEYQDTNTVQFRLAQLLSLKHHNLCVVGDDDQSIYGWRGAEVDHILRFNPETLIKLEQNYRSVPPILAAANGVIRNNQTRHAKELWTQKKSTRPLELFHAPTETDEASAVIARLISLHKNQKIPWKEIAILYRSNTLAQPFEKALLDATWLKEGKWVRGIPYKVFGGTEIYERSEIKDLIAYLKVIANVLDQEAILRIINVPRRGISDTALDHLTKRNRAENIPLWDLLSQITRQDYSDREEELALSSKALKGIAQFVQAIEKAREKFASLPLAPTLEWFLEEIDYKKAIEEEVKSDKMRTFKGENVSYCIASLASYEEEMKEQGFEQEISLQHFLSHTLLDKTHFDRREGKNDALSLMTMHSAKGLEFSACFLIGLEDHLIPHEKSQGDKNIEEERRLMYVALTRAKEYLSLSMARKRKRHGKEVHCQPSRFLFEIPKELIKITSWQSSSGW